MPDFSGQGPARHQVNPMRWTAREASTTPQITTSCHRAYAERVRFGYMDDIVMQA